jgi:DNA-binding transcriptional LysR family regulator
MMSMHRLWLLRQIDVHGGVSAAAAAVGYTPSAVSQQVRLLEREAGVPLTEKVGRGVRLTAAGKALLPHVDALLTSLEQAEAAVARHRHTVAGTVRLGAFQTFARSRVPQAIRSLRDRHPDLTVQVHEAEPEVSLHALDAGTLDVVVAFDYDLVAPATRPAGVRVDLIVEPVHLVGSIASVVAVPGDHSGGDHDPAPVALGTLAEARWILPPTGTACHDMVVRACARAGFEPEPVARSSDFGVVCALAAAGHGVGLVPALGIDRRHNGLAVVPTNPLLTRTVFVATRAGSDDHPHVAALVATLRDGTELVTAVRPDAGARP